MTTEDDAKCPVQETAGNDFGYYSKGPRLSIEETPTLEPKRCRRQNVDKMLETNVDDKLDNRAIEDRGPDHKPSMCNLQGHMDFSCNGPNSNVSEDEEKSLDDTSAKDNGSTAFQQDGNNTMSCAIENDALIVPLSGAIFKESNLAPEGHSFNDSSTEFSETEHNAKVGYRPNDEKRAIPEVSETGQNASNFKTADSNNIYEDTIITGGKLQDGGDRENKSAIDLENETSTDHGRDNNDSLWRRSNIKETDVKEEKSDGTLPKANASEGLQQDVTKDIRLDGHAAMTLKSQDSTTAILEEKTLTRQSNRSNDSTSNHFESGQNGDVGCRSSGDVQAHHEGNIFSPLVCQTGGHSSSDCIGCNQSTNILKIDVGTSTDPYNRGSKSKKRRRNKCRVDNLSIDRPEDNISSGQEGNKIGLNSQNQAPVIEKSLNALATTSDTSFQQDGNVSVITKAGRHTSLSCPSENYTTSGSKIEGEGPSSASKSSGSTVLWNASNIFIMVFTVLIVASTMAQGMPNEKSMRESVAEHTETADSTTQLAPDEGDTRTAASPGQESWQQFWFHTTEGSLIDQVLTIKDMNYRRSGGCTFNFSAVPFFKNCSHLGFLVFVKNKTCVEMLTKDLTTEDWIMEYGSTRNGDGLPAARGGTLNETSVLEKIAEYTEPAEGSAQGWSAGYIVKITAGVGVPLLLVLFILYIFCPEFKRWVNDVVCRRGRRNTNNVPDANLESNTNDIPLLPKTSTNGTTNGGLQNGESKSETSSVQMETDTTTQAEDSALPCSQ